MKKLTKEQCLALIEQRNIIWHNDLEKIVESVYGQRIDIQGGEKPNNSFESGDTLDDQYWDDECDQFIHDFQNGNIDEGCYDVELLMTDLARKGYFKPGPYLIKIWW